MIKRLARKIAQKHIELRYPHLRLQPDYGERNASDFLGERSVAMNMGYGDRLHPGPGNAFEDEIVANFEADFFGEETEGFEIIDDIGIMADFDKESRVKSHKHHSEKDVADSMEEHGMDKNQGWQKYEGAMSPDGLDESRIEENLSKQAHYEIIDDLEW